MKKHYLAILVSLLFIIACKPSATTEKEQIKTETKEAPSTPAPPNNADFNKFTVDDVAAERIKNFLTNNFLTSSLSVLSEEDRKFQLYRIDLNEDGVNEYFVRFNSSFFCGAGGCLHLLLNNDLSLINKFNIMPPPIFVSKTKTNGWRNIMIKSEGVFRELIYADGKYPASPTKVAPSDNSPGNDDEVLFDDAVPSKKYSF